MGADDIIGQDLKAFEVALDGSCFRIRFSRPDGSLSTLRLPSACLQALVLTLPKMMLEALKAQHQDESLRLVYPAQTVRVEQAQPRGPAAGTTILTLATPDGFEVSFGLTRAQIQAVGAAQATQETALSAPKPALAAVYN